MSLTFNPFTGTFDFKGSSSSSSPDFATRETPTGAVDGVNVTFTLANTPTLGTEQVYWNGLLQDLGSGNDYTISGGTITFTSPPQVGDKIRVSYQY